jgi:hypothetical protein
MKTFVVLSLTVAFVATATGAMVAVTRPLKLLCAAFCVLTLGVLAYHVLHV